ncbi:MAG: HyaD/HybD family hydrogenase maturation endopeptidase [Gemmatimonadetes bacterium]|nr:HyaD/HybD family hydrogenase maturation endopeptidase [Gemmatimonadota bacterium]NNM32773.1 HyaD/HybD family hydrogenase maturation endopeptidase [Gemmatimonadota bacterium]
METDGSARLSVVGLGNVLCRDDGLGVAAVTRLLERFRLGDGVVALDGGTLGMSLMSHLADVPNVLLVDAVELDSPPGTLVELAGESVALAAAQRLSVHQVGVVDLLDGLRLIGRYPATIGLVGMVPETTELGVELSPAVEAQMSALVQRLAERIVALGFEAVPVPSTSDGGHEDQVRLGPWGRNVAVGM